MNFSIHRQKRPPLRRKRGFALVVTLSLMILLTIIAVGLLSLSAVSLRSSSQGMAQAEAQANARLALMLAIGELQKELGPDQRISAQAGILDNSPDDVKVDGVVNPHYLGVWDSWDAWLTDKKGSLSIQDTYKHGRDSSLFRKWLVSHPDSDNYQTAISATPTADMIELCGEGSAGPDPASHVMASRIPVVKATRKTGSYAWWVSDESQKARLNLKPREDASSIMDAQIVASHTGRTGIEKMDGMSDFDTTPAALEKMITTGQAGISAAGVSEHFHDLTAYSLGLLTDVRSGGFKADLNLAFESDTVPEEMDEATVFGKRFDAPIRPMTGELAKITPQIPDIGPMAWRQMREYYRLYRSGFSDSSIMRPVAWNGGKPGTKRFLMGREEFFDWDTKGYARQLVMLRQTFVIAASAQVDTALPGGIDYSILAIPVITLWNPYNVAMQVDAKEISYTGGLYASFNLWQRVYRDGALVGERPFPDASEETWGRNKPASARLNPQYWRPNKPNGEILGNLLGFRMVMTGGGAGSAPIMFEPGEVRVFSTDSRIQGTPGAGFGAFYASPGYTLVQTPTPGASVLRGLKYQVYPGPNPAPTPGAAPVPADLKFSLGLGGAATNNVGSLGTSRHSGIVWNFQNSLQNDSDTVYEDGSNADKPSLGDTWWDMLYLGATNLAWFQPTEAAGSLGWVVSDDPGSRAQWPTPGSPPLPVGIISVVAKSPERLNFIDSSGQVRDDALAKDFRNRGWLHAPATRLTNFLMNPVDLNRADSPYQIHFQAVNGDQEVSQYLEANGQNGYFGGGHTSAGGQTHVTALNLPTVPITNLGSFAGIRMDRGISREPVSTSGGNATTLKIKYKSHSAAAFGAGIGNAYAHPMIEADGVYTRNDFGKDAGTEGKVGTASNLNLTDDYWDHLFLANEELWDSWFCSGIAPVVSNGSVDTPKKTVASDFFSNKPTQPSPHFQPNLRGKTPQDLADLVETTSATSGRNGWDLIGSHILNRGQFNVNSTSKEAWKALLLSLADRPIASNDPQSGTSVIPGDENQVSLSRHPLANSTAEATGPGDENAWRGIRKLSVAQIDKLAEEIVRQVKLRGPFLNMTEFINRRLSTDATGVTGALQAAIDWDEFNAGYDGTTQGSGESINKDYKSGGDMISKSALSAAYPNEKAAAGSRYAGIPGYVMQSDLLQGISSSLSVRGDTFVVRAYGESLTPDGKLAAAAWCEAVVQRMPEYVDAADAADRKMRIAGQLPGGPSPLQAANGTFGRQFKITSFRWLNKSEI